MQRQNGKKKKKKKTVQECPVTETRGVNRYILMSSFSNVNLLTFVLLDCAYLDVPNLLSHIPM